MAKPSFNKSLGYVYRKAEGHPSSNSWGYVYEHILVAEKKLGRPLLMGEEVHHLDFDRSNNTPENLMVLSGAAHRQLHTWLESVGCIPASANTTCMTKIRRCKTCTFPLSNQQTTFCSKACVKKTGRLKHLPKLKGKRVSKKRLHTALSKWPYVKVAQMLGMSDNGVRKLAKRLGLNPKDYRNGKYLPNG